MEKDYNEDDQNWIIPETQEEEDTTPLFENVSPQPKTSETDSLHHLYFIEQGEWNDFQNNLQSNQLSPTLENESPSMDILPLGNSASSPPQTLLIGTSLPSFIRKKLPKEEQEKFTNTRMLMFKRDYFFAVMDEENDELDRLVCIDKADLTIKPKHENASVKRGRALATSDDEAESIDSECDLYVDEAETDESADFQEYQDYVESEEDEYEKPVKSKRKARSKVSSSTPREKRVSDSSSSSKKASSSTDTSSSSSSSTNNITVHFFGDDIESGMFLTSTIHAPCRTKTGAKAIKPNAYVNKRTTIKQTDKTLLLNVNNPFGNLERSDFEFFIIVDDSCHGEELVLKDQLTEKTMTVKKLILDPEDESLLSIVQEKKTDEGWELSCQVSTSNNFGWRSKHKYYRFLVQSHIKDVQSCVSEEFRVSQNVSSLLTIDYNFAVCPKYETDQQ